MTDFTMPTIATPKRKVQSVMTDMLANVGQAVVGVPQDQRTPIPTGGLVDPYRDQNKRLPTSTQAGPQAPNPYASIVGAKGADPYEVRDNIGTLASAGPGAANAANPNGVGVKSASKNVLVRKIGDGADGTEYGKEYWAWEAADNGPDYNYGQDNTAAGAKSSQQYNADGTLYVKPIAGYGPGDNDPAGSGRKSDPVAGMLTVALSNNPYSPGTEAYRARQNQVSQNINDAYLGAERSLVDSFAANGRMSSGAANLLAAERGRALSAAQNDMQANDPMRALGYIGNTIGIRSQQQAYDQANAVNPLAVEGMRLNLAGAAQGQAFDAAANPLRLDAMRNTNANTVQQMNFARDLFPIQKRGAELGVDAQTTANAMNSLSYAERAATLETVIQKAKDEGALVGLNVDAAKELAKMNANDWPDWAKNLVRVALIGGGAGGGFLVGGPVGALYGAGIGGSAAANVR